jgi:prephenate dehydrogenase
MWGELCMDNNEYLIRELDGFIKSLTLYRDALSAGDKDELVRLLEEGSRLKGELDHK